MRRRIGEATEVIRGVVTSSRVIGLDPPHEGQRETEFRVKVAEVMTGSMRAGGEILITAIGSVEAVLPAGLEHVVLLIPTRPRQGHERYAVLGGPHGRFALTGGVCRLECFRRGEVVAVAEMPRDRFESILSAAIKPSGSGRRP